MLACCLVSFFLLFVSVSFVFFVLFDSYLFVQPFFLSQNVIYELINTEQVYMDDLSATLEVSIRVEC